MQIKKRHVQMARAAWRVSPLFDQSRGIWAVVRWHRAAKGKHQ